MPRNAAGNYTLPLPPVVPGNTIVASFENTTDSDIAAELTNSLDRNGRGGMLGPFKIADGTESAPGIAFTLDPDNGFYRQNTDRWSLVVAGVTLMTFTPGLVSLTGGINVVGTTGGIGQATVGLAKLTVNSVNPATAADGAFMAFSRVANYAAYFGIDFDNQWKVGGSSMGANAYKLLHEGNSFTIAGNGDLSITKKITSTSDIFARDITANRGDGTGLYLFGGAGSRWLYFNGARYHFTTAALSMEGGLGIGVTGSATLSYPLQVKLAANQSFAVAASNGLPLIGACDDAGIFINVSLWGSSATLPCYDNALTLGDGTHRWKSVWAITGTIQTSDARLKKNVQDSVLGLSFIEGLRPVSYQWINGGNVGGQKVVGEKDIPETIDVDGTVTPAHTQPIHEITVTPTTGTDTHFGLIAQEVRQAVVAVGVDIKTFGGFVQLDPSNPESELGLNYGEFISPLIKAVQELSARVAALEAAP